MISIPLLTPYESQLLSLLKDCAHWIDTTNQLSALPNLPDALPSALEYKATQDSLHPRDKVVLRVAGGWVRDKLLQKPSDDIDISTSPYPLTGFAFAQLLHQYCHTILLQPELIGKIAKIDANPLQSKHLETATVPVLGFSVDFVQLRGGEVYDEGSRIPNAVQFGTPLDDASRRDLTINSLFYNLHSEQIEDHTQLGLHDLGLPDISTRLIRTPLEPFQTFRDDPLRVVRAVRFASRLGGLGFVVDEQIREAVKREEIRDALRDHKKISRERVGTELTKMLRGPDPLLALKLIESLDLHPLIFLYEPADLVPSHQPDPETKLSVVAATILSRLVDSGDTTYPPLHPLLTFSFVESAASSNLPAESTNSPTQYTKAESLRKLYQNCGLLPLYHLTSTDGKMKRPIWLGEKIVKEGIKGTNADRIFSIKSRESSILLAGGVERFVRARKEGGAIGGGEGIGSGNGKEREEIGLLLRGAAVHDISEGIGDNRGATWNMSLFWSLVVELSKISFESGDEMTTKRRSEELIEKYNEFVRIVLSLNLHERAFDRPLLNGKEINALLPSTQNSPATALILSLVIRHQIGHPEASKEDSAAWLGGEGREEVERIMSSQEAEKKAGKKKGKGAEGGGGEGKGKKRKESA